MYKRQFFPLPHFRYTRQISRSVNVNYLDSLFSAAAPEMVRAGPCHGWGPARFWKLQENGQSRFPHQPRHQHVKLRASAGGTNGHRLLLETPFIFWTRLNFKNPEAGVEED